MRITLNAVSTNPDATVHHHVEAICSWGKNKNKGSLHRQEVDDENTYFRNMFLTLYMPTYSTV